MKPATYADAVLARVEIEGLPVPELWPYEVANGLAIAHVRQRYDAAYVALAVRD